ncbi:MAG: hypothetical protein ABI200_05595, partial [Gaiellales bacterium]
MTAPADHLPREPAERRVLPYFLAMLAAFATVPLPPATRADGGVLMLIVAALLTFATVAGLLLVQTLERTAGAVSRWLVATPVYLTFGTIALMRHAEGASSSGFGVLVLLPLLYLSMHTGRRQLLVGLLLMALTFVTPIVVFGAPDYPSAEWRRALLWLLVGSIATFTIQRLVANMRVDAREATSMARTDPLTGLANRRAMADTL